MATAPHSLPYVQEAVLPWDQAFDQQAQRELIEEDMLAGRSVCGVLIAIVTCGLLLGIAAVLLCV
jgi:hypothetical protein